MREIHHLIAENLIAEPFACAPDYESAHAFLEGEALVGDGPLPNAVVSLHVRPACGPCPVCEPEAFARAERIRKMRNGAEAIPMRFGVVGEVPSSRLSARNGIAKH